MAGYCSCAVHFDGNTFLEWPSLAGVVDNNKFSFSFWYRSPNGHNWPYPGTIFSVDPLYKGAFSYRAYCAVSDNQFEILFGDNTFANFLDLFNANGGVTFRPSLTPVCYHHLLFTCDLNAGVDQYACVIDGIPFYMNLLGAGAGQHPNALFQATDNTPFTIQILNKLLSIGSDLNGSNLIADIADVWIAPGVSLLDPGAPATAPAINQSTINLFRDRPGIVGRPMDIAGLPAAAIILSGNPQNFIKNRGTSGDPVLTGTLKAADSPHSQRILSVTKTTIVGRQCNIDSAGNGQFRTGFVIPADYTNNNIWYCWGMGQNGQTNAGGGAGGAGANFSQLANVPFNPGDRPFVQIGAGTLIDGINVYNAPGSPGASSFLKSLANAKILAASGGALGDVDIGDISFTGGLGSASGVGFDGGGGGAAGVLGIGSNAVNGIGGDSGPDINGHIATGVPFDNAVTPANTNGVCFIDSDGSTNYNLGGYLNNRTGPAGGGCGGTGADNGATFGVQSGAGSGGGPFSGGVWGFGGEGSLVIVYQTPDVVGHACNCGPQTGGPVLIPLPLPRYAKTPGLAFWPSKERAKP